MTPPAPTAAPPTPTEAPLAWEQLGVAEFTWPFPSDDGAGPSRCGSVKFPDIEAPELKIEGVKASGTDKQKTKIGGVEVGEGTVEFHWTRWNDRASFAFIKLYLPGGQRKGQPAEVRHPLFDLIDVHRVILHKMKISILGDTRKCVATWKEWNEAPAAVAGATTTPKDASGWAGGANAPGGQQAAYAQAMAAGASAAQAYQTNPTPENFAAVQTATTNANAAAAGASMPNPPATSPS